jgi:hypothetical protein
MEAKMEGIHRIQSSDDIKKEIEGIEEDWEGDKGEERQPQGIQLRDLIVERQRVKIEFYQIFKHKTSKRVSRETRVRRSLKEEIMKR